MRVQKFDKSQVREILIAMIVDPVVVGRLAAKWEKQMFADEWPNLVGDWCVSFFNKYGKAPGKSIHGLFTSWAEDNNDKTNVELVDKFLTSLSGEYANLKKDSNSSFVIDMATEYFNKVRVERHIESLQGHLDSGKIDKAFKQANTFGKLDMGMQHVVNLFTDRSVIKKSFAEQGKPLIEYPGALGNFFGSAFERDSFVAMMGPEKRGKTWWLIDIAWRAMLQNRRVAFFEAGDMSQDQVTRRFAIRASGRPLKPCKILIPTGLEHPEGDTVQSDEIKFEERVFKHRLNADKAWQAFVAISKKLNSRDPFKMWCYPNSTLAITGIHSELQTVARRSGWIPDVIVIDYADILAPPPGYTESRDQINATWKAMRALSQQLHCCVVTATQSDAASYYVGIIDKSNFSEDKRKFAHVTSMFAINQTAPEKEKGVMRLNPLVIRESEFNEKKCVHVAGCLALANPAIKSTF